MLAQQQDERMRTLAEQQDERMRRALSQQQQQHVEEIRRLGDAIRALDGQATAAVTAPSASASAAGACRTH